MRKTTIVLLSLVTTLLVTGCGDSEPNWARMTVDHWSAQEAANYYTITDVQECDARIDGDARQVHCRLGVRMNANLMDIESERGSVTESPVVAELAHRFGRFEAGDERTVAVITRFEKDGRRWRVAAQ